jgi:predicted DNA-binding WGR domain protein
VDHFKKLFGRRAARPDAGDGNAPPRMRENAHSGPQGGRSVAPTVADLTPAPHHAYFEFVGGASAKYYALSLEEEAGGTWRVRFTFGRIGSRRAWESRIESASWQKAAQTYQALVDEKVGKGYEFRPWPGSLKLPDGATIADDDPSSAGSQDQVLFRASRRGNLPPASGGIVAGVQLPGGVLYVPEADGGSRGDQPVIWASTAPVPDVGRVWSVISSAFAETGLWPLIVDAQYGFRGYDDYLWDSPRGRHTEVLTILRRYWDGVVGDDDEYPMEDIEPFGRQFPGLADATPGDRPASIAHLVRDLSGHLALVAVNRPADAVDAIGWMGATNYGYDALDLSTVLRSWELRFDAYLVGLGPDTMTLAVGRPPRGVATASAIAAEHFAFCPDNIQQGAGSIREYAALLVNQPLWWFWWD